MTANQSPEFPSVGARARFTPKRFMPGSIVERYGGRECEMEEFSGNLYTIVFDDGQICYADTDELSPLPAAPLNEETE